MNDFAPLDHPIWHALSTGHESMALSHGKARRYPNNVSPLAALQEPSREAFADMLKLVDVGESIALFTTEPVDVPTEWETARATWMNQMVCSRFVTEPSGSSLLMLGDADVPEMLALTALTEPGPFRPETIRMGQYLGIRAEEGRLAAITGQRLKLAAFTEVSAVCTHPDFRRRGYAKMLVAAVTAGIFKAGRTPFLNVLPENPARFVYEQVGFRFRRQIRLTVVQRK